jgi:hypothetical protein
MNLNELKKFINGLPEEMGEWSVVNGEVGYLDPSDDNSMVYRLDKPIIALFVDESSQEICLFHQTQDDVTGMLDGGE